MVVALDGFLDAGNAGALAARHLVRTGASTPDGGGVVVATFDVDEFHDYRARRPPMTFARDHYEGYDAPRLVVRLLHDACGAPYLLLHGPEPDIRWEAFCRAVLEVVDRFSVSLVVSMGSVPMAVPHTRPIAITHHANNPDLLTGTSPWRGELRVPSSAQALLEVRLGEWGRDAQGFVAHVPHYLAQLDYPRASKALLEQVEIASRLTIDLDDLGVAADEREEEIARYLSANAEVQDVVTALEQQYDTFARAEEEGRSLLAEDEPLPTGEDLGRQFEQFLAGLEGPDEGQGGSPR
ncbi:PAC2 family protein [Nocardioides caeni]|uniref:PAC2 family protein n=2 Tax=Nocardioides caeni TaxID=574700 RepID=A0A4S8NV55_9ACTN|nr:PAC2 family protein [Nocardioides caeni]